jgi:hypothetical protein
MFPAKKQLFNLKGCVMDEDIFILVVSILFAMDMVRKGY